MSPRTTRESLRVDLKLLPSDTPNAVSREPILGDMTEAFVGILGIELGAEKKWGAMPHACVSMAPWLLDIASQARRAVEIDTPTRGK